MEDTSFTKVGFVKTFILPGLLIFLVPCISYFFFKHVESTYDEQARTEIISQIKTDPDLSDEDRKSALELFTEVPLSKLIVHEEFEEMIDSQAHFEYWSFRWAIRLSFYSIVSGIAIFFAAVICVLFSLHSQYVQYLSLSIGWQLLRFYGALQVIIQGILLVALSFWVTAFFAESYYPKLIFIAGAAALVAMGVTIYAIFKPLADDSELEGVVIGRDQSRSLWTKLDSICDKVGTDPPDQVIAGIDSNFFVTEHPIKTTDKIACHGRTLFISLSLLKQLNGSEADAIMAHEMAHFSGNDTIFTKKISPLLNRYNNYLHALYEGGITLPVFYFMNFFRALFEMSLGRLSRTREFRADKIAAETTSPNDLSGALLRISSYSAYRDKVQEEIFMKEEVLESADICDLIEEGYEEYATGFLNTPDVKVFQTAHPFDSHPPLGERLEAVMSPIDGIHARNVLERPGDGEWFDRIDSAEEIEDKLWVKFEDEFLKAHSESLPYRFLPSTEEQTKVVEQAFPEISFEGKEGALTINYQGLHFEKWDHALKFNKINDMELSDSEVLTIKHKEDNKSQKSRIKLRKLNDKNSALEKINEYYSRYQIAIAYQEEMAKQQTDKSKEESIS